MGFGTIILIILGLVAGYFIGKWISDQKKWGTKKAELEKRFEETKSSLEKEILEKEKDQEKEIKELSLANEKKVNLLKERFIESITHHRKDAINRSRNTIMGKLWETIAPYIPNFKYNPADMKFMGAPIDYIIFEGMKEKDIKKVIFLEVKSGNSRLNAQERKLKEAIQNKRVKWEEFRLDDICSSPEINDKIIVKDIKDEIEEISENLEEEISEDLEEN